MSLNLIMKSLMVGVAAVGFYALQAQAAVTNYNSCVDAQGQGFGGLPCSVSPADDNLNPVPYELFNPEHQDTEQNMESVLSYVFGYDVDVSLVVHGLEGDAPGFNFYPNDITNSSTVWVKTDQTYDFASVKAGTFFAIFDIRDQTWFDLTTEDLIVNLQFKNGRWKKEGIDISHVSFWNLDGGTDVPAPAGLAVLGMGLLGLGVARRRKS